MLLLRNFRTFLLAGLFLVRFAEAEESTAKAPSRKPNVLFIAIDDMRDWTGYLGHRQAKTPNLDRLAGRGLHFTRSYCAAPVCNPSRTAVLTGLRPSSSGIYDNRDDWRPSLAEAVTLPLHFKRHGYYVAGAGKIYHGSFPRLSDWDEFHSRRNRRKNGAREQLQSDDSIGEEKIEAGPGETQIGPIVFGPAPWGDAEMPDYDSAGYILEKLSEKREQPFFLACGFQKPHLPWRVPKKYFDLFPLDKIELPPVQDGDLADVPPAAVRMANPKEHAAILRAGKWKEAVQAYLAAISFTDAMLGRLLDGLEASPAKDNTIICLWSDHGWHLGEKEHWRKFALWEEATRSPLIFVAPGLTRPGTACERPVDFMSLYPTLSDLCGLPIPPHLQGPSLRPLLADPKAPWNRPAITTHLAGNHAIRTERWRYIRYADGSEELYDHDADPREWTNLAKDEKHAGVKKELSAWLPK